MIKRKTKIVYLCAAKSFGDNKKKEEKR